MVAMRGGRRNWRGFKFEKTRLKEAESGKGRVVFCRGSRNVAIYRGVRTHDPRRRVMPNRRTEGGISRLAAPWEQVRARLRPRRGVLQSEHAVASLYVALLEPSPIHLQGELCRRHGGVHGRRQRRHVGDVQNYPTFIQKRDA